jgi:hypothetical protein
LLNADRGSETNVRIWLHGSDGTSRRGTVDLRDLGREVPRRRSAAQQTKAKCIDIITITKRDGVRADDLADTRDADTKGILTKYREIGCFDAEVGAEPRFSSQTGIIDLLYRISEGDEDSLAEPDIERRNSRKRIW